MTLQKPSKEEQVRALIEHKAFNLAQQYSSKEILDETAYKQTFSIKRKDIIDFLKVKYLPKDVMPMKPSIRDGFYAIPSGKGEYITYEQYDGFKFEERLVNSEDKLWDLFTDYLIRTSGTAIDFDR